MADCTHILHPCGGQRDIRPDAPFEQRPPVDHHRASEDGDERGVQRRDGEEQVVPVAEFPDTSRAGCYRWSWAVDAHNGILFNGAAFSSVCS